MLAKATNNGPINPSKTKAMMVEHNQYGHLGRSGLSLRIKNNGMAAQVTVTTSTTDQRIGTCEVEGRGSAHADWGVSRSTNNASKTMRLTQCA